MFANGSKHRSCGQAQYLRTTAVSVLDPVGKSLKIPVWMLSSVKAWQLRQAARQELGAGNVERALELAIEAQGTQGTGSGASLRLLSTWLKTIGAS
jgi:hypothetical protein